MILGLTVIADADEEKWFVPIPTPSRPSTSRSDVAAVDDGDEPDQEALPLADNADAVPEVPQTLLDPSSQGS